MSFCIAKCSMIDCDSTLRSPFRGRPAEHDPDGMGAFCAELADELGIECDEISTTDVARAWARASGWTEIDGEWRCSLHGVKP